jgi:hypothetical protein
MTVLFAPPSQGFERERAQAATREGQLGTELNAVRLELRRALAASAAQLRETSQASASIEDVVPATETRESDALDRRIEKELQKAQLQISNLLGAHVDSNLNGGGPDAHREHGPSLGRATSTSSDCTHLPPVSPARLQGQLLTQKLIDVKGRYTHAVLRSLAMQGVRLCWRHWHGAVRSLQADIVQERHATLREQELAAALEEQRTDFEARLEENEERAERQRAAAEVLTHSLRAREKELEADVARALRAADERASAIERRATNETAQLQAALAETASVEERLKSEAAARTALAERATRLEDRLEREVAQKMAAISQVSVLEGRMAAIQEAADAAQHALRQNAFVLSQVEAQHTATLTSLLLEMQAIEAGRAKVDVALVAARVDGADSMAQLSRLRAELDIARGNAPAASSAASPLSVSLPSPSPSGFDRSLAQPPTNAPTLLPAPPQPTPATPAPTWAVPASPVVSAWSTRARLAEAVNITTLAHELGKAERACIALELRHGEERGRMHVQAAVSQRCLTSDLLEVERAIEDTISRRLAKAESLLTERLSAAAETKLLTEREAATRVANELRAALADKGREVDVLTAQLEASILQGMQRHEKKAAIPTAASRLGNLGVNLGATVGGVFRGTG